MKVTKDIIYVGVNDHELDLFEGQYIIPEEMAYNSYVILDSLQFARRSLRQTRMSAPLSVYSPSDRRRMPQFFLPSH